MPNCIVPTESMREKLRLTRPATLWPRTARIHHAEGCSACNADIFAKEKYYQVYYSGSGLRGMKYPDRICLSCVEGSMNGSEQ